MVQERMLASSFLILLVMPRTARCCLHCERNFTNKFNFYRKHLWGRSSWAGDMIFCQNFIDSWMNEIKECKVAIPKGNLVVIAEDIYGQMDLQYKLSNTGIGYFPKALQRIKRSEVEQINEAIKESLRVCSEHCGTHKIDYIDCANCETKTVECGKKCSGGSLFPTGAQEIGHRRASNPVNSTSEGKGHLTSKSVAIILIPIIIAIIAFLAAFGGLFYCSKRTKTKKGEKRRKRSKSRGRQLTRKRTHKSSHRKKSERRKSKVKHNTSYSTE